MFKRLLTLVIPETESSGTTIVVVVVEVVVIDVPFGDLTTHRSPLGDFLHRYLTVFTVRSVPAFAHLVPTTCGALETDETLKSVREKQIPRATPMCFFIM
jgi:hypothetical protein